MEEVRKGIMFIFFKKKKLIGTGTGKENTDRERDREIGAMGGKENKHFLFTGLDTITGKYVYSVFLLHSYAYLHYFFHSTILFCFYLIITTIIASQ